MSESIYLWGDHGVQGVYLLEIALSQPLTLAFGRFQQGRRFTLPAGTYLYVGSALGQRGATTLAGRLLRHATRTMAPRCRNKNAATGISITCLTKGPSS